MKTALELDAVRVVTDGQPIVGVEHLRVQEGHPLTVMGETGAGKSLLLQAVMATLPAGLHAEGQISVDGSVLGVEARQQLWGKRLALLPQEPMLALDPLMRSSVQVSEVHRWLHGAGIEASDIATEKALEAVGLEDARGKLPGQLSGGMAQRLAFAAATAGGAGILLADEPTKGLDERSRDAVLDLLSEHAKQDCLLVVTHDLQVPRRLGGDLAILRNGKIVEQGPAGQLMQAAEHPYTRELLATDTPLARTTKAWIDDGGDPVVTGENLGLERGGRALFEGVGLHVGRGEIVGLAGPSGVGKSSLGDALLGLLPLREGQVRRDEGAQTIRFQKLYQDPPAAFAPRVPLRQLLADLCRLHQLHPKSLAALLEELAIDSSILERPVDAVSGGELQRIALARVLLLEPVFLFADEPVSRLDPITARRVLEVLVHHARERQCGVLLVGHDRAQLGKMCDRVFSLQQSKPGSLEPARLAEG